jgi:hypothetical protein
MKISRALLSQHWYQPGFGLPRLGKAGEDYQFFGLGHGAASWKGL